MPPRLRSLLTAVFRADPGRRDGTRDARRDALLQDFDARYGLATGAATFTNSWRSVAVGAAVCAAVAVGACAMPADYTVGMGVRLSIVLGQDALEDADPSAISDYLQQTYALEKLGIRIKHRVDARGREEVRVQVDMVGRDVEADAVWSDLVEAFPDLEGCRGDEEEPFEARVEGTLGGRLAHRYLDLLIDQDGVEAAQRQILADLEAQGLEGSAEVSVDERLGHREVRVEVEAHTPGTAPGPALRDVGAQSEPSR